MKYAMMIGALMLGAALSLSAGNLDEKMLLTKGVKVQDGVFSNSVKNNKFAPIMFKIQEANEPAKVLSLEYRVIAPETKTAQFAVRFQNGKKWTYAHFPAKAEWTKISIKFSSLHYESSWKGKTPEADAVFTVLHLYGRNNTPADIELQVRNVSIDQSAK